MRSPVVRLSVFPSTCRHILYGHLCSQYAAVASGLNNTASSQFAFVGGGSANAASGALSAVCGGGENSAAGEAAAVVGGVNNTASGAYSLAAGVGAVANHSNAAVLAFQQEEENGTATTCSSMGPGTLHVCVDDERDGGGFFVNQQLLNISSIESQLAAADDENSQLQDEVGRSVGRSVGRTGDVGGNARLCGVRWGG